MKTVNISEITALSKEVAEKRAKEEASYDLNYECHLVPVYVVVKTDSSGRIASYSSPSNIPMGHFLEEANKEQEKVEELKNVVKTINGWVQVKNSFVKKVGEGVYDVIRLENGDEFIHYDSYSKVDLNTVTKDTFSQYGNYNEYLKEKTEEEKAIYTAFLGLNYHSTYGCESEEEVNIYLKEDGVIPQEETFKMGI